MALTVTRLLVMSPLIYTINISADWIIFFIFIFIVICFALALCLKILKRQQKILKYTLRKNGKNNPECNVVDKTDKENMTITNKKPNPIKRSETMNGKSLSRKDYDYIIQVVKINKLYLNPELTIIDVASSCKMPYKKISQLVNYFYGKNFNHLINQMRIEEAIKIIENEEKDYLTLEGIAYEAGFNSKSVFNTFFKKTTGLTPSNYKRKIKPAESA